MNSTLVSVTGQGRLNDIQIVLRNLAAVRSINQDVFGRLPSTHSHVGGESSLRSIIGQHTTAVSFRDKSARDFPEVSGARPHVTEHRR
ncbi:hypothetical protein ACSRUE_11060 [Sorangium sp. KYC3313]|uniref:hypothetical protein n=1 Tax=Sorangium sp. KYC3313 TaxID=3449740 RepID=UPI003F899080